MSDKSHLRQLTKGLTKGWLRNSDFEFMISKSLLFLIYPLLKW